MMNVRREQSATRGIIRSLEYKATWFGLLRIIGWMVFFLFLGGIVIPRPAIDVPLQNNLEGTHVIPMNTETNDPRWVRNNIDLFPRSDHKNIAWITESSIAYGENKDQSGIISHKIRYLPDEVNRLLEEKHNVKANAFLYFLAAGRVLDTYTMVKDALARKPDAMVVVLNPFWIYNNKAVFNKISVFNRGAGLWWNDSDWTWQFALASPRSHLWSLIGQHIPIVASSHDYKVIIDDKAGAILGVKHPEPDHRVIAQGALDNNLHFNQSLMFWVFFRVYGGNTNYVYPNGKISIPAWQNASMALSDTSDNAFSSVIVRRMMETIKNSGTPTLLYLAPVSPKIRVSNIASESYDRIIKSLFNLKLEYETKNIRIVINFPRSVTDSIEFFDSVHLRNDGLLSDVISEEVLKIVRRQ